MPGHPARRHRRRMSLIAALTAMITALGVVTPSVAAASIGDHIGSVKRFVTTSIDEALIWGKEQVERLPWVGDDDAEGPTVQEVSTASGTVKGKVVCAPGAAPDGGQVDSWDYAPVLTDQSGLALTKLRFGPRLLADAIDIPYVRITDTKGRVHLVHLTPKAVQGPGLPRVGLVSAPLCRAADADANKPGSAILGVSATYRVLLNEGGAEALEVLIEQSYRFDPALDARCEPTMTAQCVRFWPTTTWVIPERYEAKVNDKVAVDIVQRFRLNPDQGSRLRPAASGPGFNSADLIRDVPAHHGTIPGPYGVDIPVLHGPPHVEDLGEDGRLKWAAATKILDAGVGGHWENIHQTSRQGVALPGITPGSIDPKWGGGTAGCTECVHAHWTWFATPTAAGTARAASNIFACGSSDCWSDGAPQILAGSEQTVCLGWDTGEATTAVDWCAQAGKGSATKPKWGKELARNKPPVFYYDARSKALRSQAAAVGSSARIRLGGMDYAYGDAYWPYLPPQPQGNPHPHGGNGSFFFVPARKFTTVVDYLPDGPCNLSCEEEARIDQPLTTPAPRLIAPRTAMIAPRFPAQRTAEGTWMLKVDLATGDPGDLGPYYLRVRTGGGLKLLNADPLYRPGRGGAAWVGVYEEGPRARAEDLSKVASWHPVAAKAGNPKPLTAVLLFDEEPSANKISFQLDAAPYGVDHYVRSDGLLPSPDAVDISSVDWKRLSYAQVGCMTPEEAGQGNWDRYGVDVRHEDITGDGAPEVYVVFECPAVTSSWPMNVVVYDVRGKQPQVIGVINDADGEALHFIDEEVSVTPGKIEMSGTSTDGNFDIPADARHWGLLRYEWNGTRFVMTEREQALTTQPIRHEGLPDGTHTVMLAESDPGEVYLDRILLLSSEQEIARCNAENPGASRRGECFLHGGAVQDRESDLVRAIRLAPGMTLTYSNGADTFRVPAAERETYLAEHKGYWYEVESRNGDIVSMSEIFSP